MSARHLPDLSSPEALALLAAIVMSSDDAIVSKNLNGIVTSWNPGAQRIFGYDATEMVGQSILRIIPPELRHEETHIIGKIRAGERISHFETVRLRKDGRRIHVSLTVSPVKNAVGEIVGASKIARDVSGEYAADRARALLAAIVDSSDDAIISKDLNSVVTSWNPAAERMYGWSAEEMIGNPIHRILPPDLQSEEETIIARIRAGEKLDHYETQRMRKDGRRIEVSITVSPVRDRAGRIIGASKTARDITAQRAAQREKDEFLAILAHELRNPLAPISGALEILDRAGVAEDRRDQALNIAKRQVKHMAHLLDDLLDVARISTGRVELKPTRFELSPLVDHAVAASMSQIQARNHTVKTDLAAEPIWLYADQARVLQIVSNLLTNSAKYTDPGGEIEVSTRRIGSMAQIRVKDNGIGMSPGLVDQLFTLFARGNDPKTRSAGGLGIGLALVREFVERHGGKVKATSQGPGKGSEFVVDLPVAP